MCLFSYSAFGPNEVTKALYTGKIDSENDASNGLQYVVGITLLLNRLFVIRYPNNQQISVYCAEKLEIIKTVNIDNLGHSTHNGLTSSVHLKDYRLYVGDYENNCIYKVQVDVGQPLTYGVTTFVKIDKPRGLSVNNEHHLLVSIRFKCAIVMFDEDGTRLREISLQSNVKNENVNPWHVVQIKDQLVVIHGMPDYNLSVATVPVPDDNATVLKTKSKWRVAES